MSLNTTYFLNLLAGNVFRSKLTPSLPGTLYVGVSSTAPGMDGTGFTEPADSAYSRVQLTGMGSPANGVVTNTAYINFPESVKNWGVMTHFGIFDAKSAGNLLMYGKLEPSRTVESASAIIFKPGTLKLSMRNPAESEG